MTHPLSIALSAAAKNFGQCAKAIELRAGSTPLTPNDYECLIGFGMAYDWVGWARHFSELSYTDKRRSVSDRAHSINELTRFTFLWTAANALFARTNVLHLLDPNIASRSTELERFRVLFNSSNLSTAIITAREKSLHSLLRLPMHVQHFPWTPINNPPTILEVIYFKYTVPNEQSRGLGKKLLKAATTGNYESLDLPTLIYATRNWNIHGVLLSSSFRGTRKKFNLWIDTINLTLAEVLANSSKALHDAV
jgi:hypothetical protein